MQKFLITLGLLLTIAGFFWSWIGAIPFGRLPGDVLIDKPNLKVYFPITTMVVVSVIVSLIIWFFRK